MDDFKETRRQLSQTKFEASFDALIEKYPKAEICMMVTYHDRKRWVEYVFPPAFSVGSWTTSRVEGAFIRALSVHGPLWFLEQSMCHLFAGGYWCVVVVCVFVLRITSTQGLFSFSQAWHATGVPCCARCLAYCSIAHRLAPSSRRWRALRFFGCPSGVHRLPYRQLRNPITRHPCPTPSVPRDMNLAAHVVKPATPHPTPTLPVGFPVFTIVVLF